MFWDYSFWASSRLRLFTSTSQHIKLRIKLKRLIVSESNNWVNSILTFNSLLTVGLILNQNESAKDSITTQSSSTITNPLEILTWVCLTLQIILLLVKFKLTDF